VDVRGKPHAVAHRHHHVARDRDRLAGLCLRRSRTFVGDDKRKRGECWKNRVEWQARTTHQSAPASNLLHVVKTTQGVVTLPASRQARPLLLHTT
jgi:hypothetical protein